MLAAIRTGDQESDSPLTNALERIASERRFVDPPINELDIATNSLALILQEAQREYQPESESWRQDRIEELMIFTDSYLRLLDALAANGVRTSKYKPRSEDLLLGPLAELESLWKAERRSHPASTVVDERPYGGHRPLRGRDG
jgi:hypothetical protein